MADMTTMRACPALTALRLVNMRTGHTRVVAVMLGPSQPQVRPFVSGQEQVLDLVASRRRRAQQHADLAIGQSLLKGDYRAE